jgi:hypothetical protein
MLMIAPALLAWAMTATTPPPQQPATADEAPSEARVNPAQPDFTLLALPTTLRLPRHKSAFRVTHRFGRSLGAGDFGDLANDFFGFDSGAQIGLEYRFGIARGIQAGIHRTSDKTIEFFGEYTPLTQTSTRWFSAAALVAVEGINNFRDDFAPTLGAILGHEFGRHGAFYLEPIWVGNSNPVPADHVDEGTGAHVDDTRDQTLLLGIGGRWRVRPTVYLVGEIVPRVAGYDPGVNHASFGIEKRVGGHSFQINFSNTQATTFRQIARGGFSNDSWYIGFNISRKFF